MELSGGPRRSSNFQDALRDDVAALIGKAARCRT